MPERNVKLVKQILLRWRKTIKNTFQNGGSEKEHLKKL